MPTVFHVRAISKASTHPFLTPARIISGNDSLSMRSRSHYVALVVTFLVAIEHNMEPWATLRTIKPPVPSCNSPFGLELRQEASNELSSDSNKLAHVPLR